MESHFVKLEPPYQSIHYGGEVGIQIGTLIVVGESYPGQPGLDIYTHSHPVVSYINKQLMRKELRHDHGDRIKASYYGGGEGNVWSKVQVSDVDIIGMYDPEEEKTQFAFEWNDFKVLISDGFSLTDAKNGNLRPNGVLNLYDNLRRVGLIVLPPSPVEHLKMTLSLSLHCSSPRYKYYTLFCQDEDGLIEFSIPFTGKTPDYVTECFNRFISQYLSLMKSLSATIEFSVGPMLGEDEELNSIDTSKDEKKINYFVDLLNDTYNEKYRMQQK